jgi:uncharacterized protein (DUF885 family)
MRRLAVLVVAVAAACGNPAPSKKPHTPDPDTTSPDLTATATAKPTLEARRKQLADLLTEQWQSNLERHPEFATILGDHRWDDRWTDPSLEAIAAEQAKNAEYLERFRAVDTTGFPEQELLNQQLMVRNLEEEIEGARFEEWLMPINQQGGPHIQLPQFASMIRFTSVEDYDNYLKRLDQVPGLFDKIIVLMRTGMEKGLMPPKEQLVLATAQTAELAKAKAKDSPFLLPLTKFTEAIPAADQTRIRDSLMKIIEEKIQPTYVKLAAFLKDEYAPKGRADAGVWALPDGDARYAYAVKQMTTTDMTPDEIHELGLAEVTRIEGEQEAIGKKLGFKSLAAFRKHIRKNKKLYAKSKKDILARYQKHTDAMYEQLPKLFGRLPEQKMTIEATEAFREKDASGAEYKPGAPDGSRPGRVQVNTATPTKRLWIDMESTAYHEGVPGHHLQLTIQQELPQMPPFRQFGGYTAYIEGWALYAEQLGKDVGFYQDPYSDYGRLQDEMLRAIRLVVDTGLHAKKWTRDQVVKFFHDHSTIDEPSVQSESSRYIVWPGQALAYKIGQLTILRLREQARTAQGDAFDIRAFHDFILGAGALPLDVLETRFDAWVAAAP